MSNPIKKRKKTKKRKKIQKKVKSHFYLNKIKNESFLNKLSWKKNSKTSS
jgi:hypothetical protein